MKNTRVNEQKQSLEQLWRLKGTWVPETLKSDLGTWTLETLWHLKYT